MRDFLDDGVCEFLVTRSDQDGCALLCEKAGRRLPMPPVAPVTNATFPSSRTSDLLLVGMG